MDTNFFWFLAGFIASAILIVGVLTYNYITIKRIIDEILDGIDDEEE